MLKNAFTPVVLISTLMLFACSGDDNDNDQQTPEVEPTRVIFSPATGELPVPNDLLFSREELGDGTMNAGTDPANPVITAIDTLDGASVIAPVDITFSDSINNAQTLDAANFVAVGSNVIPNPEQNVFLLPLTYPGGDALVQASLDTDGDGVKESVEIPTFSEAIAYQRAVAAQDAAALAALAVPTARAEILSLDGGVDNVIRITPLKPLLPETKYLVVLTDIEDAAGDPVAPSVAYDIVRGLESPEGPFGALRNAIHGWERLAAGYFGFKQQVFTAAEVPATVPAKEDIIFSLTFTTGGTDSVLKSVAAPEYFFEKSLRTAYKQDAIAKLVSGVYNVSGDNTGLSDTTDGTINTTLNFLLTSETLPDMSPNPLYNANIAGAIAAGADFATIAADASAAFIMQTAAAEAAITVHNSADQMQGDKTPYVDIAAEAAGTVVAIAEGAGAPVSALFPVPAARETTFYRVDDAADINPALAASARVYQGEITLPMLQSTPEGGNGSVLKSSRWTANETIGAIIDAARQNPEGTTPPSSMVTYRYPFPTKTGDVTVPVMVTMPDETTLTNFGITRPENGWPVVIYVHGITTDRSISLPMATAMAFACVEQDQTGPSGAPCYATVAIDQPLHGVAAEGSIVPGLISVTDPNNIIEPNLASGTPSEGLTERHFDFTADAALNPIPMDYNTDFGASGGLFINLTNFANVRDNLRQMSVDLLNLNASLATMDVDGNGEADDLDIDNVFVLGHSLGGIDSIPFIAVNNSEAVQGSPFSSQPRIKAFSAMSAGGGIPRILTNSVAFSPLIMQGLAGASEELVFGRSGLETYLSIFQGVLDSVDPINFAAQLSDANSSTGVLLTEIVGDGADNPPDTVIPNAADSIWGEEYGPLNTVLENGFTIGNFRAPLAGTEPLAAQFDAVKTAEAESDGDAAVLITRYTEGSHTNPITAGNIEVDPYSSQAVFFETLSQTVTFFALEGDVPGSIVTNPDVVEP